MFKPKMLLAITAGLSVAALTACSGAASPAAAPSGQSSTFQTVTPGVLTIATELGNPGWVNGTDPGNLSGGVEYEMAQEMAKQWGISKVVFKNVSFTPLVSGSVSDYDIGLMTIFKTPAREQVNQYSDCYYPALTGLLVKKGTSVTSADDVKKLTWGYVTGGYAGLVIQKLNPDKTAKSFQDGPTEYNALLSGTIDGVMDDLSSIAGRSQQPGFEDTKVAALVQANGAPSSCSAAQLPKNAPAANVAAVNAALGKMKDSGQMAAWEKKYLSTLGQDPSAYQTITVG